MADESDCTMTIEIEDPANLIPLVRQRDELLAVLKAVIAESDRNTAPYIAARALIARIEGGNG